MCHPSLIDGLVGAFFEYYERQFTYPSSSSIFMCGRGYRYSPPPLARIAPIMGKIIARISMTVMIPDTTIRPIMNTTAATAAASRLPAVIPIKTRKPSRLKAITESSTIITVIVK